MTLAGALKLELRYSKGNIFHTDLTNLEGLLPKYGKGCAGSSGSADVSLKVTGVLRRQGTDGDGR